MLGSTSKSNEAPGGSNITHRQKPLDRRALNFFLPGGFQPLWTLVRSYQSGTGVPLWQSERV